MYSKLCELMEKTGATGISQTAFSNWKSGVSNPGTKNLMALAKHFNVPMEYFMEDTQDA